MALALGAGLYFLLGVDDDTPPADPPVVETPLAEAPPTSDGSMPRVTTSGTQIMLGDVPWWFLGYNSFVWSGDCGRDDEKMTVEQVDEWFASMRDDGRSAVRLFFYDGWDIERLDAAVESAKRHNVYLTITLDDAIGGCGESKKEVNWFADEAERSTYRDHMTMLLERYRGETAIAWFEYFNEPKFYDGALRAFIDEMGSVADQVDPDRLWSTGTIAPFDLDGEDNFRVVHESSYVDIASLHEYDENEVESNHGPRVLRNAAGKPTIVGEFGIEASDTAPCPRDFAARASQFAGKVKVYTDTSRGYAGAFAWAWQPGNVDVCRFENLTDDQASQDVLRNASR